ncbi:MAG: HEAT repeat domain-containing protein [Armatimonadota bacterium]|nr:HEAT repeat domain-containing protein [Armatimonadota bacterium]
MNSRAVTWGVVGVLAALFIYWQYSNYAHNNQLNTDLGNDHNLKAQIAAAQELIDKKQLGDVLPTTLPEVHLRVMGALQAIARDTGHKDRATEALTQLVNMMKEPDEGRRLKAQNLLVQLGPIAIPGVVTALGDADAHAKKGAIAVMDRIALQPDSSAATIKALVDAVQKSDPERAAAVDALVVLAPTPTPQMLTLLKDPKKEVRSAAANYFGNSALPPAKPQTAGEPLLLTLLKDKDVRPAAIRAEGLLRDTRALPEITKALSAPADVTNRRTAIVALGDMRDPSAIPSIIPFLHNSDPDLQSVSVVALHNMGPEAVPALTAGASSKDPVIRKGIADSLQGDTTPAAVALLSRGLQDPDKTVRQSAATSLGTVGNSAAVAPLIAALRDPSPDVAEAAEASLSQVGPAAVNPLVATLGAGQPAGQAAPNGGMSALVAADYAAKALALIGPPAAPAVIAAAQNGPIPARTQAIVTLASLRTPAAVPVLQSIAQTGPQQLRWYASDALRHYQG